MGESPPLRNQLHADLTDNLSATMTAVGLAVVAFALVSVDSSPLPVSADFDARFLLSLSLMDLAFVCEDYWPVEYEPRDAVIWTLLCGGITTLVFLGVYRETGRVPRGRSEIRDFRDDETLRVSNHSTPRVKAVNL